MKIQKSFLKSFALLIFAFMIYKCSDDTLYSDLGHGSLLIMKGATQKLWEHEVPKTKKKVSGRINLTFRYIV